jgi:hypothetical protein
LFEEGDGQLLRPAEHDNIASQKAHYTFRKYSQGEVDPWEKLSDRQHVIPVSQQ